MAYGSTLIGKIELKQQSGWGTAQSSFGATDVVECELFLPPLTREVIAPETFRGGFYQQSTQAGSKAGAEVQLRMPLLGVSSTTPVANPTSHFQALLMGDALGAVASDGYQTDLTSGGTTTTVPVTTGVEAHSGYAILVPISGGHSIGWISQHTANVYTVSPLSAAPSTSGTVYGSACAYLSGDSPANGWTLRTTLDVVGGVTLYDGIVVRTAVVAPAKGQPMMEVTLRFANWSIIAAGTVSPYAYSYPQLPVMAGANGARGTDPTSSECYASSTFEAAVEAEEVPCYSGNQGVGRYTVTGRTVRLTTESPMTDIDNDMVAVGASAGGVVQIDYCTTPGRAASVLIPSPTIVEQSTIVALGKVIGQRTVVAPSLYTGDTESTAPADTAARFAWL